VRCGNLFILAQMILPFWQRLLFDPAKLASIVFDTASKRAHKQPIGTAEQRNRPTERQQVQLEANPNIRPLTGACSVKVHTMRFEREQTNRRQPSLAATIAGHVCPIGEAVSSRSYVAPCMVRAAGVSRNADCAGLIW